MDKALEALCRLKPNELTVVIATAQALLISNQQPSGRNADNRRGSSRAAKPSKKDGLSKKGSRKTGKTKKKKSKKGPLKSNFSGHPAFEAFKASQKILNSFTKAQKVKLSDFVPRVTGDGLVEPNQSWPVPVLDFIEARNCYFRFKASDQGQELAKRPQDTFAPLNKDSDDPNPEGGKASTGQSGKTRGASATRDKSFAAVADAHEIDVVAFKPRRRRRTVKPQRNPEDGSDDPNASDEEQQGAAQAEPVQNPAWAVWHQTYKALVSDAQLLAVKQQELRDQLADAQRQHQSAVDNDGSQSFEAKQLRPIVQMLSRKYESVRHETIAVSGELSDHAANEPYEF